MRLDTSWAACLSLALALHPIVASANEDNVVVERQVAGNRPAANPVPGVPAAPVNPVAPVAPGAAADDDDDEPAAPVVPGAAAADDDDEPAAPVAPGVAADDDDEPAVPVAPAAPGARPQAPAADAAVAPADLIDAEKPQQIPPVTTYAIKKFGKGEPEEIQVVFTQLFDDVPDQWSKPKKGKIGLGKIKGKVGVVKDQKKKRDALLPEVDHGHHEAEPGPAPASPSSEAPGSLEKRKGSGSSGGRGSSLSDGASHFLGPTSLSVLFSCGLLALAVSACI